MSKRNDIIYTAIRLFNENSFNSVGVDRIILESKVAKMTFYKYFPSKEQLIHDCLVQRHKNVEQFLMLGINKYPNEPLNQLNEIFRRYDEWFKRPDFHGSLFQKAIEELNGIYPALVEPAKAYNQWLIQLIGRLLLDLKVENPIHLQGIIVSLLDGMTIQAYINQQIIDIDEYWKRVELMLQAETKTDA